MEYAKRIVDMGKRVFIRLRPDRQSVQHSRAIGTSPPLPALYQMVSAQPHWHIQQNAKNNQSHQNRVMREAMMRSHLDRGKSHRIAGHLLSCNPSARHIGREVGLPAQSPTSAASWNGTKAQ